MDLILILVLIVIVAAVIVITSGVKIVQPYEQAIYMRLGKFVRVLNQGLNIVCPLINEVVKMDLRTEVLDVPKQEVITKDNSPVEVDAVIYIKVTDPRNAFFEVTNYKLATVNLAQTTLRSIIGEMELDEILSSREKINVSLRDILDENTDKWGVKIEAVEIREVDPARKVKDSMEEQTSAERRRRAAILEADGLKRAAILEAEGKRLATILEGQGEAQKLRILSVGAASMDSKAMSVLSMQTLQEVGKGESSKFFFPMELTRLVEGVSDYIGSANKVPDRQVSDIEDVKNSIGDPDDILGPIPKPEELKSEKDKFKDETLTETEDVEEVLSKEKMV